MVAETGVLSYIAASGVGGSVTNLLWHEVEEEGDTGDPARFSPAICLLEDWVLIWTGGTRRTVPTVWVYDPSFFFFFFGAYFYEYC